MNELSAFAGREGYGACDDAGGLGSAPTSSKPPGPAKREPDGFPQVYIHLPCLPVSQAPVSARLRFRQMIFHISDHGADLLHRVRQLSSGTPQLFAPIADFPFLIDVDHLGVLRMAAL